MAAERWSIERGVDVAVGSVDRAEALCDRVWPWVSDHADEWAEEACAKLDEQNAELDSGRSQTIEAGLPDTLD